MAFNSETVCRAVAGAATPIVSAVGHERDVTLCDLVADVRVATPTAVAEAVVPSAAALDTHLGDAGPGDRAGARARPAPRPRRPSPGARRRSGAGAAGPRGDRARPRRAPRAAARRGPAPGGGRGARAAGRARGRARARDRGPARRPRRPASRGRRACWGCCRRGGRWRAATPSCATAADARVIASAERHPAPATGSSIELRDGSVAARHGDGGGRDDRPARRSPPPPSRRPCACSTRWSRGSRAARWASRRRWRSSSAGRATWRCAGSGSRPLSAGSRSSPRRAFRPRRAPRRRPTRRSDRSWRALHRSSRFRSRSIVERGTWQPAPPTLAYESRRSSSARSVIHFASTSSPTGRRGPPGTPVRSGNCTQYSRTGAIERGSRATTGRWG